MKRLFLPAVLVFPLAVALSVGAQSGAVIPQGGAGHADQASCVILKRMGPADQVTSHLYSFGIRGKQFQYIEGKLPQGFPFHGRMTDHDVRNLQGRGAEVIVLESGYTAEDLKTARAQCSAMTNKTPNQAAVPASSATTSAGPAEAAGNKATNSAAPLAATLDCSSTPAGADIEVDGSFVGNTPSSVGLDPGEHTIKISKSGYMPWERKIKTSSGNVKIAAELQPDNSKK